jgi:hypothetical protein
LSHREQVQALAANSIDKLAEKYFLGSLSSSDFRHYLAAQSDLWDARNVKTFDTAGGAPTKDMVLGAWRDLDRCEALLELIDNSIDVWLRRREEYPSKTATELNIYIDLDSQTGQLTYEDNAGGVPIDKLSNLVVPGFSDTTALTKSIGSYKTGGKKAIFRLSTEARITTRYLNPAGTSDDAVSVHLDKRWMDDLEEYKFTYATLKDRSTIEKGQTRYVLSLRREPPDTPWYESPEEIGGISKQISKTYTLLLLRNPRIKIHFNDREHPLEPETSLYDFCGTDVGQSDIRPQGITFDVELEYEGKLHKVELEIILGCRQTTGGSSWGIDLYGNDRLFVSYDQETFEHWLPKGASRGLVRGLVNIKGPNVFIPWDTHKRHLNVDREIIRILTKHKVVKEFFDNWARVYKDISALGKGEVSKFIRTPLSPKTKGHDLNIPHREVVAIDVKPRQKDSLPKDVFKPAVKIKPAKKPESIQVKFAVAAEDARRICSYYGLSGSPNGADLSTAIKDDVIKRSKRGR